MIVRATEVGFYGGVIRRPSDPDFEYEGELGSWMVLVSGSSKQTTEPSGNLLDVLNSLDCQNDDNWTKLGVPSVAAVSSLVGRDVTRQQISEALPDLYRDKNG